MTLAPSPSHETASSPELASLAERLVEVGRQWGTSQRQLVVLAAQFDESGAWAFDGSPTCSHWIASALDVEVCTAREWLRIGHRLESLPTIDAAFAEQRLSYSKVRALSRVATPDSELELCELAERVPAGRLASHLSAWLNRNEETEDTERRHAEQRHLSWRVEPDGMVSGSFRLPPLEAGAFISAIDSDVMRHRPTSPDVATADPTSAERADSAPADASDPGDEPAAVAAERYPSFGQQRADALVRLMSSGGGSTVTEVVLHVRGDGCTLDDGTPVADSAVARLVPESFIRLLIHDAERQPINASGRHRHPTLRQKRFVKERDRVCVDCESNEHHEYDHLPDFEESRRTVVDELQLRCSTCHRRRHTSQRGVSQQRGR